MALLNDTQRQELKETLSLEFSNAYRIIERRLKVRFGIEFDMHEVVTHWEENLIDAIQDQLDFLEDMAECD